eukprot:s777_g30.t1
MVSGTELAGEVPICGVFEKTFKHAEMSVPQLNRMGISAKRKQFYSCCSSGDKEIDEQVLSKTLEEVEAGSASGPWGLEDVPDDAVLSKRSGLRQPGKIRLIDDLSGSHVNSTVQAAESPKPQNVDFIGAMLLSVLQTNSSAVEVLGRTYDLKSAYKQLAIAPASLPYAYVVIFNPHKKKPEIYQLLAAPFGATRSVYSFLRIVHSVWYIGVKALGIVWSHFFDDFVAVCCNLHANNTATTVDMLFKLLGWKYAEQGDKATSFGQRITALGVEIDLSEAHNGSVTFSNTEKRRTELKATIAEILSKGRMTMLEAQKTRGTNAIHGWTIVWASRQTLHASSAAWVCGLGGVLVSPAGEKLAFFSVCLTREQINSLGALEKKTIIFEAELLAMILAYALWKEKSLAQSLVCFVDNNSARDVAISGCGRNEVARALVEFLLKLEMDASSTPWYARVPTPSNIADEPSRGDVERLLTAGAEPHDPSQQLDQVLQVLGEFAGKVG